MLPSLTIFSCFFHPCTFAFCVFDPPQEKKKGPQVEATLQVSFHKSKSADWIYHILYFLKA